MYRCKVLLGFLSFWKKSGAKRKQKTIFLLPSFDPQLTEKPLLVLISFTSFLCFPLIYVFTRSIFSLLKLYLMPKRFSRPLFIYSPRFVVCSVEKKFRFFPFHENPRTIFALQTLLHQTEVQMKIFEKRHCQTTLGDTMLFSFASYLHLISASFFCLFIMILQLYLNNIIDFSTFLRLV
jgi:hypothetical protein